MKMNYFAHALPLLDRPYCMAGAAVPDWLMVADRTLRLRSKHAKPFIDDADAITSEVAAGVLRHLDEDARFHATRAFAETSLAITILAREALGNENGPRPAFLGHLLTDLLLDAELIAEAPARSRRRSTAWPRGRRDGWPRSSSFFAASGCCGTIWTMRS